MNPATATITDSVGPSLLWSMPPQWSGVTLGRYTIGAEIGRGAMGVVLEAHDARLDRRVAIKVMQRGEPVEDRRRLLREARAMARLSHPCVVPVYDVGTHGLATYVVMELVTAPTLAVWLGERHSIAQRLAVLASAGQGLAAAHAVGIVHRDFRPPNVLVGADGRARVTDFGLALGVASDGPYESPCAGTPAYMAPEQHAGTDVDARSDQYAFCLTAWEVLYGVRPFARVPVGELGAVKSLGPPSIPTDGEVPRSIGLALQRGLSPTPSRR